MNLIPIGTPTIRDTRANDLRSVNDDASTSSFASILAGASAEPQHVKAPEPKRAEGTSELDSASEDETSTDDAAKTPSEKAVNRMMELGTAAAGLAPGLKDKLARVVSRMRDEFGKTVTVNEGVRSQERQNALFAQGRTVVGPVVTWTKNSQHLKGNAADLLVNGGYDDAQGFAALQRVAREEGLHTLGKIDPGHVELRAPIDSSEFVEGFGKSVKANLAANVAMTTRPNQVAQVAQVASVAQVALPSTARVATVANIAQASVGAAAVSRAHSNDVQSRGKESTSHGGSDRGEQRSNSRTPIAAPQDTNPNNVRAYADMQRADAALLASDAPITSASNLAASSASRVEQLMDLQESRAPKVLSHLNVALDDGQGGRDMVRIGMRGNEVGATFDMRDSMSATRISARLGELTSALERRGLEPQSFNVRHSGHANELDAIGARATTVLSSSDTTATRNEDQGSARGFNRNAPNRDEQAARRQDADDRRRQNTTFSLTTEEA